MIICDICCECCEDLEKCLLGEMILTIEEQEEQEQENYLL